jgi:hypothetical protein
MNLSDPNYQTPGHPWLVGGSFLFKNPTVLPQGSVLHGRKGSGSGTGVENKNLLKERGQRI